MIRIAVVVIAAIAAGSLAAAPASAAAPESRKGMPLKVAGTPPAGLESLLVSGGRQLVIGAREYDRTMKKKTAKSVSAGRTGEEPAGMRIAAETDSERRNR